jgi:hypothetical protein
MKIDEQLENAIEKLHMGLADVVLSGKGDITKAQRGVYLRDAQRGIRDGVAFCKKALSAIEKQK